MLQLIKGITAFFEQVTDMWEKRTEQLCEMHLSYTKFEICERKVFLKIKNQ